MAYIVYCKMTGKRLAEYKNKETLKGLNLDKCYFVESKPMSNIIQERVGADGRVSSGNIPHGNHIAINDSNPRKTIAFKERQSLVIQATTAEIQQYH